MTKPLTLDEQTALLAAGPEAMAEWVAKALREDIGELLGITNVEVVRLHVVDPGPNGWATLDDVEFAVVLNAAVLDEAGTEDTPSNVLAQDDTGITHIDVVRVEAPGGDISRLWRPYGKATLSDAELGVLTVVVDEAKPEDPRSAVLAQALAADRTGS